jgi:hypothetical protein
VGVIAGPFPLRPHHARRRLPLLAQPAALHAHEGAFGLAAKPPLRSRQPPRSALLGTLAAVLLAGLVERPQADRRRA